MGFSTFWHGSGDIQQTSYNVIHTTYIKNHLYRGLSTRSTGAASKTTMVYKPRLQSGSFIPAFSLDDISANSMLSVNLTLLGEVLAKVSYVHTLSWHSTALRRILYIAYLFANQFELLRNNFSSQSIATGMEDRSSMLLDWFIIQNLNFSKCGGNKLRQRR